MNLVQRAQLPLLGGRRINPLATIATRTVPWFDRAMQVAARLPAGRSFTGCRGVVGGYAKVGAGHAHDEIGIELLVGPGPVTLSPADSLMEVRRFRSNI